MADGEELDQLREHEVAVATGEREGELRGEQAVGRTDVVAPARDGEREIPLPRGIRNVEYSVGNSSTRTASPEYGRQRKMPARNRR